MNTYAKICAFIWDNLDNDDALNKLFSSWQELPSCMSSPTQIHVNGYGDNVQFRLDLLSSAVEKDKPYLPEIIRLMPPLEIYKTLFENRYPKPIVSRIRTAVLQHTCPEKLKAIFANSKNNILDLMVTCGYNASLINCFLAKLDQATIDEYAQSSQTLLPITKFNTPRSQETISAASCIAKKLSKSILAGILISKLDLETLVSLPRDSAPSLLPIFIDALLTTQPDYPIPKALLPQFSEENIALYLAQRPEIEKTYLEQIPTKFDSDSQNLFNKFMSVLLAQNKDIKLGKEAIINLHRPNKALYLIKHPEIDHPSTSLQITQDELNNTKRAVISFLDIFRIFNGSDLPKVIAAIMLGYLETEAMVARAKYELELPHTKIEDDKDEYANNNRSSTSMASMLKSLGFMSTGLKALKIMSFPVDEQKAQANNCTKDSCKKAIFEWESHKSWRPKFTRAGEKAAVEQFNYNLLRFGLECRQTPERDNGFFIAVFDQLRQNSVQILGRSTQDIRQAVLTQIYQHNNQCNMQPINDTYMLASLAKALRINIAVIRSDKNEPVIIKEPDAITTIYLGYDAFNNSYKSLVTLQKTESLQRYFESPFDSGTVYLRRG